MTTILEQVPPHSIESEQRVLGGMLQERDAIEKALALLHAADFYRESHRVIFETISDMAARSVPADLALVAEELKRREQLDAIGGMLYLQDLEASGAPFVIERHALIVKGRAIDRAAIRAGWELIENAYRPDADPDVYLATMANNIETMQDTGQASDEPISLLEAAEATRDIVLSIRDTGAQAGITTGWHALDELIRIITPGELVIVGARTGMGKTRLLLNLAMHLGGRCQVPALAVSYEMPREQIGKRAMEHFLHDGADPFHDHGSDWILGEMEGALTALAHVNVQVVDNALVTVSKLRNIARRWVRKQRRHGHKVCCIFVDYAQLVPGDPEKRSEQRYEQVGAITRELKQLAVTLKVPVIALAQLSRTSETRSPKRPFLSDLRESGNMEQDADKVIVIYRPSYFGDEECNHPAVALPHEWRPVNPGEEPARATIAELLVLKNRHGATGTALVNWHGQYGFSNLDREQWRQIKELRGGK
jgi:replicative DNA helicase